ncbi:cytochrome B [Vibrio sp. 10N.286.49.C2]|uniref:cytochrome b n=1 Tax=unclassified Vibrio TaxID=2614977 RepID=UPI000C84A9EB|nr:MULTISPECIES: cytochrome b [unclassified Vibrio]PMH38328.1 cytochrome B [Vibrio sp. 10N.286.49.C2]PMH55736.1 cytochrome B [Vibrio sp. 10N.286.49.B1]PMH80024.1 cytochrome B [Vibrio sp. 10N.286.48.B7]
MKNKLSIPTIVFHWVTGLLFIGVMALGLYVEGLPRAPEKFELLGIHKSLGVIVLVVAILRLFWRLKEGSISSVAKLTNIQKVLATGVHHALLLGTLLMPISGVMMSIGSGRAIDLFGLELISAGAKVEWLSGLGGNIHGIAANVLIAALVLHIVGALKHQIIDKDGTVSRMLGRKVDAHQSV